MKVITSYPVIIEGNSPSYSNANGKKKKGGGLGSLVGSGKVKGFLEKVGGASTGLAGVLGGGAAAPTQEVPMAAPTTEPTPEKKPLSMGAKIGIGVGIAAILGVGIYFATKKK